MRCLAVEQAMTLRVHPTINLDWAGAQGRDPVVFTETRSA